MEERTIRSPKATRVCQHRDVRNTRAISLLRYDPLNFYLLHSFGYISFFPHFLYFSDLLYFNANCIAV